jgi:hypothetical protein
MILSHKAVMIILILTPIILSINGCSAPLDPVDTVKAFERVVKKGDTDRAMGYIGGDFNPEDILKTQQVPNWSDEQIDKHEILSTYTLMEEAGDTAKVRVETDIEAWTEGVDFSLMGEMGADLEKMMKATATIDYSLQKLGGKWKIVGWDLPNAEGLIEEY